ncbi:segregation/condensation protein A [Archaeoglobus profundus]|uniref:Chromosome segregation and condensation protein ScpA n=1 Tax=Archaeoglobus profundus (strain DSM 5631 / JCM 9629 / NBRC 100127 / Av18) TaxID=572546 RepID=D2RFP1_ARCPA|nr:ScpA family protein [Archaeoglobus profundus]ADB57116.1 chromosome segregation and condensation protein ScpA [Archaeoglobus profundus DSM 5631]
MAKKGEIDPWNIDIVDLTDKFLQKIEDLRVSGRIILYASILLRMKSEVLLNEIYGEEDEDYELDFNSDLNNVDLFNDVRIDIPIVRRKVKRYTTLDELVRELRRIERLKERRAKRKRVEKRIVSFENVPHEEDVEEKIVEVYKSLLSLGMKEISFLNLVRGFDKPKKVTYYISILHLAYRKKLKVEQEKPYEDIRVILNERGD